ncbi:MAG: penicillin-binding protein 2 [Candidatus Sericytochromatia bacterium]|nr:penicillin-binding protein 2 [Candidatus Sericytochromatia bacterium]
MVDARRSVSLRKRQAWLLGSLGLYSLILLGQFARHALFQGVDHSRKAENLRTKAFALAPERGDLVDRRGQVLALSLQRESVGYSGKERSMDPGVMAAKLAPVLGLDEAELRATLAKPRWVWLKRRIDKTTANRVRALKLGKEGIGLRPETLRSYPRGRLAASLLGWVGMDNQGLSGLEYAHDRLIRGPRQVARVESDRWGNPFFSSREAASLPATAHGRRIVLTLDARLQHHAEKALARAVLLQKAKGGTVIVMNPESGDVLALASWPDFDPNFGREAAQDVTRVKAMSDVFEPGSIMKPFTMAAAMETGHLSPDERISCAAKLHIGTATIGDHDPPAAVRILSVPEILKVSSNVGTTHIGWRMPSAVHAAQLEHLGFGRRTTPEWRGESAGLVPPQPWSRLTQATVSYGQGIAATAMQLATAMCMVANGGIQVAPRFVDRVEDEEGQLIQKLPPTTGQRVLSPKVVRDLSRMLEGVTQDGGTGTQARIADYRVAGKTGTADKVGPDGRSYGGEVIASFLGFVPAEAPKLVILASLDSPTMAHFASMTSAPLFRDVAIASLRTLGIPPSQP